MSKWWVVMPGWWWSALGFVLGTGLGMPPSGHTLIPMMRFHANDRHRVNPQKPLIVSGVFGMRGNAYMS